MWRTGKAPLQKEIEAIEAEAGGDGVVDFAQFMNFYRRKFRRPQDLEKEMREAFRALDATGYRLSSILTTSQFANPTLILFFLAVTASSPRPTSACFLAALASPSTLRMYAPPPNHLSSVAVRRYKIMYRFTYIPPHTG